MYKSDPTLINVSGNAPTTCSEAAALVFPVAASTSTAFLERDVSSLSELPRLDILDLSDNFWALTLEHTYYNATRAQFLQYQASGLYEPVSEATLLNQLLANLNLAAQHFPASLRLDSFLFLRNRGRLKSVLETAKDLLQPLPSPDPRLLAFSNGVLNLDSNLFSCHDPSNFISETMPVKYDPDAKCDLFLKMFLANVLEPADVDLLQRYLSQLLQGINHSQAILILNGDAGWGKSSLMKIIGSLLGWRKVGIIRPQLFEDEFELAHYLNKHLLYFPDMPTSFLDCPEASVFKNLVGGDPLWADVRGNRLVVQGQFPVVLSCNGLPKIDLDQDAEAWNRRLVVLSLKAPDHNKHFGKMADLLLSEASGILNWLLEGRAKLLKDKLQLVLNDEQRTRTEKLLLASDSPSMFVKSCLVRKDGDLGVMELFTYYQAWCSKNIVPPISSKAFTRIARAQIEFQFGLRFRHDVGEEASNRGWKGVGIAQT